MRPSQITLLAGLICYSPLAYTTGSQVVYHNKCVQIENISEILTKFDPVVAPGFAKIMEKLKQRDMERGLKDQPEPHTEIFLNQKTHHSPSSLRDQSSYKLFRGKKEMAHVRYSYEEGVLRFDIIVFPGFRKLGLYQFLFNYVLESVPEITSIPTISGETNYREFRKKSFGRNPIPTHLAFKKMNPQQITKVREKIIEGIKAMPAFKVRRALGYSKVESLRFSSEGKLFINFVKGEWSDDITIAHIERPYQSPPRVFELTAKGDFRPIDLERVSMPAFEDTFNPKDIP